MNDDSKNRLPRLVKAMCAARPRSAPARLLRFLPFVPLLAITMAAGPCGKQQLGSVDGGTSCTYEGKVHLAPSSFATSDGCNTCTCSSDGLLACTHRTCQDGGSDSGDASDAGLSPVCIDPNKGNVIPCADDGGKPDAFGPCVDISGAATPCPTDGGGDVCKHGGYVYPLGARFLDTDGCNICHCEGGGIAPCTTRACADGGPGAICAYAGRRYAAGATFLDTDGCSTCTCHSSGGVTCDKTSCSDAGVRTGVCTPGNDWTCNEDPTVNSVRGSCQPDGSCRCATGLVSPYTGRCLAVDNAGGSGCELGKTFPVGATFTCGDSCSTCMCAAPSKIVITDTSGCADAGGGASCGLDAVYLYGLVGGLLAYQDQVTLAPSPASPRTFATYTRTRSYVDGSPGLSCAPAFPACSDATAIDVSDIMADILDPVVQKYLLEDVAKTPFLGFDTRPIDDAAFSFLRGDGHGFLVGQACGTSAAASNCVPIPAPIDKLVKDLRALDEQQLRSSGCAALR